MSGLRSELFEEGKRVPPSLSWSIVIVVTRQSTPTNRQTHFQAKAMYEKRYPTQIIILGFATSSA